MPTRQCRLRRQEALIDSYIVASKNDCVAPSFEQYVIYTAVVNTVHMVQFFPGPCYEAILDT